MVTRESTEQEECDLSHGAMVGNTGTAKRHLASAPAFSACMQSVRVRFSGVAALVTQQTETREQHQLRRPLQQLESRDLLVLDELGYVMFSQLGAEMLFNMIDRAQERVSLIVTTNLPFEQWTEVCGSEQRPAESRESPGRRRN